MSITRDITVVVGNGSRGRVGDGYNDPIHPEMGANAAKNWEPFVNGLKAQIENSRDARVRRFAQAEYDDAMKALEGLKTAKSIGQFNMWADSLRHAKRKATDVQPVAVNDPERVEALKKHESGETRSQDKGKAKDMELPVAVKPVDLVPGPSGENNEETYAPRPVGDAEFHPFTPYQKKPEVCSICGGHKSFAHHINSEGKLIEVKPSDRAKDNKRVNDAKATLTIEHSGSAPADHLLRAATYEVQGDRARALDSYRTAASGFRKANDQAGEAKAREGIAQCQSVSYDKQYDHPGRGRTRVCDSADSALRTAVERTRAGESVQIVGTTVRPKQVESSTRVRGQDAKDKEVQPV